MIAIAVTEAVADDQFIVGMRISQSQVNDYFYKWSGKEADAKIIFSALGKSGLNYIHVTEFEAWQPAASSPFPSFSASVTQCLVCFSNS